VSVQRDIEEKIAGSLSPLHLEVINESYKHSVPEGSESHFKLVVVSDDFAGVPRIGRHKMINRLLAPEFAAGLHALSMETHTAEEWRARGGRAAETPPCLGGGKAGA
jgi:BolA protein